MQGAKLSYLAGAPSPWQLVSLVGEVHVAVIGGGGAKEEVDEQDKHVLLQ